MRLGLCSNEQQGSPSRNGSTCWMSCCHKNCHVGLPDSHKSWARHSPGRYRASAVAATEAGVVMGSEEHGPAPLPLPLAHYLLQLVQPLAFAGPLGTAGDVPLQPRATPLCYLRAA